ncbi:hypothetical protein JOB18_035257 [Solea senegalensis]|uniref:Uncharacterized protein n=1 Tax=Solea senegalensis TaxID=28829 RepID=A0AAV6Q7S4_SOLSE|nr:hypothetical protein JOB18_035257 [Solea senegalensis]
MSLRRVKRIEIICAKSFEMVNNTNTTLSGDEILPRARGGDKVGALTLDGASQKEDISAAEQKRQRDLAEKKHRGNLKWRHQTSFEVVNLIRVELDERKSTTKSKLTCGVSAPF